MWVVCSSRSLELVFCQTFSYPKVLISPLSPIFPSPQHCTFIFPSFPFFSHLFASLSSPLLSASFLYQWRASDRAGLCDFSWSSNYLNSVCCCVSLCACTCVHVCVPKHFSLLLLPIMSIRRQILESEGVNHSVSCRQKYIPAPKCSHASLGLSLTHTLTHRAADMCSHSLKMPCQSKNGFCSCNFPACV